MQISLPPSFADLTLKQLSVLMTTEDMYLRLRACSELTLDELRQCPKVLLDASNEHLTLLQEAETRKHLTIINIDGVEYGFIPDWEAFTGGEWIDIESLTPDFWNNSAQIISILYRPITKKWGERYEIEPYTAKEDAKPFERLSAELFAGAMLFFSTTRNELLRTMKSSLMEIVEKGMSSLKSGDGILSSTDLPVRTSSRWTRLRHYLLDTYSHISLSSKT